MTNEITRATVRAEFERRLNSLRVEKNVDVQSVKFHELTGFVDGLLWSDMIRDTEYFALQDEVMEAYAPDLV